MKDPEELVTCTILFFQSFLKVNVGNPVSGQVLQPLFQRLEWDQHRRKLGMVGQES